MNVFFFLSHRVAFFFHFHFHFQAFLCAVVAALLQLIPIRVVVAVQFRACVSTTSTCFNFNRTEYNDRAVTVVPWWWRWCRGGGSGGEMMKGVSPTGTEGAPTALGATFSTYGYEKEMRQHRKTATLQVGC